MIQEGKQGFVRDLSEPIFITELGCWNIVHEYILFCYIFFARLLVRMASVYSSTINIWQFLSINSHPDFCHFNRSEFNLFLQWLLGRCTSLYLLMDTSSVLFMNCLFKLLSYFPLRFPTDLHKSFVNLCMFY